MELNTRPLGVMLLIRNFVLINPSLLLRLVVHHYKKVLRNLLCEYSQEPIL